VRNFALLDNPKFRRGIPPTTTPLKKVNWFKPVEACDDEQRKPH